MCRLLGYATDGSDRSLREVLGADATAQYRDLSEIHNDGWGASLLTTPTETPNVADGGAPSPQMGSRLYRNTIAADHDPIYDDLADIPARSAVWHLRLASSNLPLILENQQPFYASGLTFAHNGDISDENGRNITLNRSYPINSELVQATGGHSDSAMYFAIVLQYLGFGFALDEAVAQAVRELRAVYPRSTYNCIIQSKDELVALRASGKGKSSPRVVAIYDRYGRGDQAADYRVMRYRAIRNEQGDAAGVVVASSGFDQSAADGWHDLENDQMLVASNRTGEFRVRSI